MQYASQNLIPVTLELGGKSPNISSPMCCRKTTLLRQGIEGFVMFASTG